MAGHTPAPQPRWPWKRGNGGTVGQSPCGWGAFVDLVAEGPGVYIALGVAALAAFVVLGMWVSRALDRRYRGRAARWAAAHGWAYRDGGGGSWTALLDQGIDRGVKFQLEGARRGRPVLVAHWWFDTRERRMDDDSIGGWEYYTETHHVMVVVVRLPTPCPEMRVEARGMGSRVARALGRRDPAALGHDAFDRAFRIRSADPATGRRLLTRRLIEAHLARRVPLWSVRGVDLVATWTGKVDPDTIPSRVDRLLTVAALLRR